MHTRAQTIHRLGEEQLATGPPLPAIRQHLLPHLPLRHSRFWRAYTLQSVMKNFRVLLLLGRMIRLAGWRGCATAQRGRKLQSKNRTASAGPEYKPPPLSRRRVGRGGQRSLLLMRRRAAPAAATRLLPPGSLACGGQREEAAGQGEQQHAACRRHPANKGRNCCVLPAASAGSSASGRSCPCSSAASSPLPQAPCLQPPASHRCGSRSQSSRRR